MKIIGIGGLSTTGKSTLANLIVQKSSKAEVIHLDFILNDLKNKLVPQDKLSKSIHGDGDILVCTNNPFNKITDSQIKNFYYLGRNILITTLVKSKLLKLSKEHYELAVIEGVILEALYLNYDYLIKTEASDKTRVERRLTRDNIVVTADILHTWDEADRQESRYRKLDYDKVIINESDLQNFDKYAQEIYLDVTKKTLSKQ